METTSYCSNRPLEYDTCDDSVPSPKGVNMQKKVHTLFNRDHLDQKEKLKLDRELDIDHAHPDEFEWDREHKFQEFGVQNSHIYV
jgi:hypothetical protein